MKQVMKSLKHNGIYVPQYEPQNFKIKIRGQSVKLTSKSEQMAIAWVRKKQSVLSPPDEVFEKNFMEEFLGQLRQENQSLEFLKNNGEKDRQIDFSEVEAYLEAEKQKKERLSQEQKKKLAAERKVCPFRTQRKVWLR